MRIDAWMLAATLLGMNAGCAFLAKPPVEESETLREVRQMTSGYSRAGEGYFSPDMNWVVFQAVPAGEEHYAMYLARTRRDAGQIVGLEPAIRISPAGSRNTCGHFSPDGQSLIFASTAGQEDPTVPGSGYQRQGRDYRWSFPSGMEIFRADGWESAALSADPETGVNLAMHAITASPGYDAEGAFSADGKWIVFSSARDDLPAEHRSRPTELLTAGPTTSAVQRPNLELYAMRSDGRDVVRLTYQRGYDGGPFFSPDGKRVVYRSDRVGNDLLQVYVADLVFDATGKIVGITNERQLTSDSNVNWGPYWHPGGRHVIYATSVHGHTNYELYLVRVSDGRRCRITFTDGPDVLPVFSPDGRYLLWTSKRTSDRTTQLFLAEFTMPRYLE